MNKRGMMKIKKGNYEDQKKGIMKIKKGSRGPEKIDSYYFVLLLIMDLFSKFFPSLKCYHDPDKCKHFKQKIKEEPEKQKDIEDIKTQIILKSINSDFKLYNKKDLELFFQQMKSYPAGSPELKACAIRLGDSYDWDSWKATNYYIKYQFSIEQLRYLYPFGVVDRDIYFRQVEKGTFFPRNNKPLFTETICQNHQLFIQMVTNKEIRLDKAPTEQLFTCLGHLKGHDQAIGLLAQKIYKSDINHINKI